MSCLKILDNISHKTRKHKLSSFYQKLSFEVWLFKEKI